MNALPQQMYATGPLGPQLMKGAFMVAPADGSSPWAVTFQYNPETISRTITPQYLKEGEGGRADQIRFRGAPTEQISAQIEIDAIDALANVDATALASGIHSQLAALTLLVYPTSTYVQSVATALQSQGTLQVIPPAAPTLFFVWGANRIAPVRIDSLDIAEQTYDPLLNPIRATVSLRMTVMSYTDAEVGSPVYSAYLTYQQNLETLASGG